MTATLRSSAIRNLTAALEEILGPAGLLTDARAMEPYGRELRGLFDAVPAMVARPACTEDVASVVRQCAAAGVGVVPQGGRTGLVGGGTVQPGSGQIILSLERMNHILHVDPLDDTMTVEAGCVLADLQQAAQKVDRFFPLSLGAEGSCQIGGNLSTNAGGINVLRYGNARDLVLGLEVVLADGRVWNGLRRLRKDNTGYDLKHLFMGAEGTLGIITKAVLKLFLRPRDVATAFVGVVSPDAAVALLPRLRGASGEQITSFELIQRFPLEVALSHTANTRDPLADSHPSYVLVELSSSQPTSGLAVALEQGLDAAMEDGLVNDAAFATSEKEADGFWRIREGIVWAQAHYGASIKHDVSIPVSRVPEFLIRADASAAAVVPGVRPCAFGHIGDGNIHYNLTGPAGMTDDAFLAFRMEINQTVHDVVAALDGSISAEHGLGQLRRDEIRRYKSPLELELMRRIKDSLDPAGLMNPGKVLPQAD